MSRKKKPELIIDEKGFAWDPDDFDLDSHGVEAPLKERLASLAESGLRPEDVSDDIRERYVKYLERERKKVKCDEKAAKWQSARAAQCKS